MTNEIKFIGTEALAIGSKRIAKLDLDPNDVEDIKDVAKQARQQGKNPRMRVEGYGSTPFTADIYINYSTTDKD